MRNFDESTRKVIDQCERIIMDGIRDIKSEWKFAKESLQRNEFDQPNLVASWGQIPGIKDKVEEKLRELSMEVSSSKEYSESAKYACTDIYQAYKHERGLKPVLELLPYHQLTIWIENSIQRRD